MECDHLIHVDAVAKSSQLLDIIISVLPWFTISSVSAVIVLTLNKK